MPRTTDAPTDADLRAALARLADGRRVRMCVPPQPDDDDMLLAAALDELAEARPVVAAARALGAHPEAGYVFDEDRGEVVCPECGAAGPPDAAPPPHEATCPWAVVRALAARDGGEGE